MLYSKTDCCTQCPDEAIKRRGLHLIPIYSYLSLRCFVSNELQKGGAMMVSARALSYGEVTYDDLVCCKLVSIALAVLTFFVC